jgi:hypothetical protein
VSLSSETTPMTSSSMWTNSKYMMLIAIQLVQIIICWGILLLAMYLKNTRQTLYTFIFRSLFSKIVDHKIHHETHKDCVGIPMNSKHPSLDSQRSIDSELINEIARIKKGATTSGSGLANDAVIIEGVSKSVNLSSALLNFNESSNENLVILDDLYLSVKKGECFGFLVSFCSSYYFGILLTKEPTYRALMVLENQPQ